MTDLVLSVEGTEFAATLALILALCSALAHAVLGTLQKSRYDPWEARGAIDAFVFVMALMAGLFILPWPEPEIIPILFGVWAIHLFYKSLQALAYERGAFTVVYPVARGTAPICTVIFASIAFGEHFEPGQWLGVAMLSGGIMSLSVVNLRGRAVSLQSETMLTALGLALLTGVMIAVYTTYDAWGIRQSADPFTFIAWFFVADGWSFPLIAWLRRRRRAEADRLPLRPLMWRGLAGALIAFVSFGCVMLATRLDKVGEAVALRETSVIFAALLGWLVLREPLGPARAGLMALIALGAAMVELAS
ncbi:MAG: multidrug transporter [Rhodobacteraceae bacterium]|uniref:EamA family transporter n=1 Tax=Albimonas donghaensis TaxID=356660 RepID=UPI000B897D2E|nr:EamA family transporter [Albimonas donghaensis]MAS43062.1 multidrug transporter [Paracoccaceae bacterium]MBR28679.1 multidrug transporter [Paracoccaceae bacterium]